MIRVVTFNIQAGVRGIDGVAATLRECAPDVACLNEVRGPHRRRLVAALGGYGLFGATIGFRRFGNMILSREPVRVIAKIRLSASPGMERRGLLVARTGGIVFAVTHLGLTGEERLRHVEEIMAALAPHDRVVLAGDLNETPDGAAVHRFEGRFVDAYRRAGGPVGATFPSNGPDRRIDYILMRGLDVESCETVATAASDHLPVVATLTV